MPRSVDQPRTMFSALCQSSATRSERPGPDHGGCRRKFQNVKGNNSVYKPETTIPRLRPARIARLIVPGRFLAPTLNSMVWHATARDGARLKGLFCALIAGQSSPGGKNVVHPANHHSCRNAPSPSEDQEERITPIGEWASLGSRPPRRSILEEDGRRFHKPKPHVEAVPGYDGMPRPTLLAESPTR